MQMQVISDNPDSLNAIDICALAKAAQAFELSQVRAIYDYWLEKLSKNTRVVTVINDNGTYTHTLISFDKYCDAR